MVIYKNVPFFQENRDILFLIFFRNFLHISLCSINRYYIYLYISGDVDQFLQMSLNFSVEVIRYTVGCLFHLAVVHWSHGSCQRVKKRDPTRSWHFFYQDGSIEYGCSFGFFKNLLLWSYIHFLVFAIFLSFLVQRIFFYTNYFKKMAKMK